MAQRILEMLAKAVSEERNAAPELAQKLDEITTLNEQLLKKPALTDADIKQLSEAYGAVKRITMNYISDPESVPASFKKLIPALKAVQAPIDCYINGLSGKPQTLEQVLSDPSWVKGYLGNPENAQEDPGYVQGSVDLSAQSFAETLDLYRTEAEKVKQGLTKHYERLSGDTETPKEVLKQKILFLQAFAESYGEQKEDIDFGPAALANYASADKPFGDDHTDMALLHESYFSGIKSGSFSLISQDGKIHRMTGIPEDVKETLFQEVEKLELKRKFLGIDQRSQDNLETASEKLITFVRTRGLLAGSTPNYMGGMENLDDPADPIYPIAQILKEKQQQVLDYIWNKPGAKAPTSADLRELVNKSIDFAKNQPILTEDGYEMRIHILGKMMDKLSPIYLEHKFVAKQIHELELSRTMGKYRELADEMASDVTPERRKEIANLQYKLVSSNLITRADAERYRFYSMAANPEYCEAELARANQGITTHADLNGNMDQDDGFHYTWNYSDFENGGYNTADLCKDICRIALVGRIIKKQRENGVIIKNFDEVAAEFADLDNNPVVRHLYAMDPQSQKKALHDETIMSGVVDAILNHPNDPLKDVSDKAINGLLQDSGNLNSSNSELYNLLSDSLKIVRGKNLTLQGAAKEDYELLAIRSIDYMNARSSDATSKNGRLRYDSAAEVLRTVGPKAALKADADTRQEILVGMTMNMFRSKEFRDACREDAKARIAAAFGGKGKISREAWTELDRETRESLKQDVRIITAANTVEESLENAHLSKVMDGKNVSAERMSGLYNAAVAALNQPRVDRMMIDKPHHVLDDAVGNEHHADEVYFI